MLPLLDAIEFRDPVRARREIASLSDGLDPAIARQIDSLLAASPDADRVLLYLVNLKQRDPDAFARISGHTSTLHCAAAVFSYSRFLSEEVLKHPDWLEVRDTAPPKQPNPRSLALSLAMFRRRRILATLIRDVRSLALLSETTSELSHLADDILETAYRRIRDDLAARHGVPRYRDEQGQLHECGMAVIALGKLGGQELNYSSDIDLMFVYTAPGETDGPYPVSNKEFFKKVANQCTEMLSTYTAGGLCYRVDLRLRPDGSLGEVCISLDGACRYYQSRARDWELQMLIKARVAAGCRETGRALLDFVQPLIYSTSLDFSAIEAVSVTRERIGEKLKQRRGSKAGFDIKLAPGGIRDIEFLVQCLQRLHGGRVPWVRQGGTLLALARLNDKDLLSGSEFARLVSAYQFLRHLEHRLQFDEDRQTHALPSDPAALDLLARKMPSTQLGSVPSGEKLVQELNRHLESVQEIYERVIHAQKPMYYSPAPAVSAEPDMELLPEAASSNLVRFLDRKAPRLAQLLALHPLRLGAAAFEHFLEKVLPHPTWLQRIDEDGLLARHILDIFEHSPYFSDELIRTPELLEVVGSLNAPAVPLGSDAAELRRAFRCEMFRIQVASLCLPAPVFETLARTSDLADLAITAAYRMALEHVSETHPPANPIYQAGAQMMVIALGRLGMREFDLASDADLVFVIPDRDQSEHVFWTRVANRLIDLISAYTGTGVMFAVDTRLRPNGGAGALVQTESAYRDYFSRHAEAWEGIAYMKSRGVAGDPDRTTVFLHDLQQVDWRRYGQSGRSRKDLRQMRMRLEKEQGLDNPLKAGRGGFYDIDFALLYLRLKSAGIFFKVLNMPERIDIIEKMGHLDRVDAEFLRDAVTFYRAVDHGLRIYSGHAEGNLPNSETQLGMLTEIVRRWTPDHLNHRPLRAQLDQIRNRTREIFDQLFTV